MCMSHLAVPEWLVTNCWGAHDINEHSNLHESLMTGPCRTMLSQQTIDVQLNVDCWLRWKLQMCLCLTSLVYACKQGQLCMWLKALGIRARHELAIWLWSKVQSYGKSHNAASGTWFQANRSVQLPQLGWLLHGSRFPQCTKIQGSQ